MLSHGNVWCSNIVLKMKKVTLQKKKYFDKCDILLKEYF